MEMKQIVCLKETLKQFLHVSYCCHGQVARACLEQILFDGAYHLVPLFALFGFLMHIILKDIEFSSW